MPHTARFPWARRRRPRPPRLPFRHFTCAGGRHVATPDGTRPFTSLTHLSMDEASVFGLTHRLRAVRASPCSGDGATPVFRRTGPRVPLKTPVDTHKDAIDSTMNHQRYPTIVIFVEHDDACDDKCPDRHDNGNGQRLAFWQARMHPGMVTPRRAVGNATDSHLSRANTDIFL